MDENIEDLVKTTTRGSLILFIGQISSTFILSFGMLLVARFLGSANYGSFNKAQSVVQIAFLVMNLGIGSAITKYIAQFRHEGKIGYIKVLIEAGTILNIVVSVILTFFIYYTAGFVANDLYKDPNQEILIKYLSFSIIGQAFMTYAQSITVGYERMELRSLIQVCYSIVKSVVSPVLVYIGFGTLGAIIGHASPILLSGFLGLIFIILLYKKERNEPRPISHLEAMKMILTFGFPLYISVLLNGVLPHLYTTLLGIWETDTQIGNYSVALNFSVLLSFITIPISTTIFPLFSKLEDSKKELSFLYRNAVKYSTLFGYPIVFTIMALADPMITILFQNEYPFSPHYLRVYMLMYSFIGLGMVCNTPLLNSQKRTDLILKSTILRFLVSVPLSYYAISHYGVIGLLFTYFVSTGINTLIDYYNLNRVFGFTINFQFVIKILGLSILSYAVVYGITTYLTVNPWLELILGGILSVAIYLIGLINSKALTKQDFAYLEKLSGSFGPASPVIRWLVDVLIRFS